MTRSPQPRLRRRILAGAAAALGLVALPRLPARAALAPTPRQTEGPFYRVELPPETDNDLVRIGTGEPAQGIVTQVAGRVLDAEGAPLAGTTVEIWQCDANGRYHHPGDRRGAPLHRAFQGFGRAVADAGGAYAFRTIRPVTYPGRTPHFHFAMPAPGRERFVTQMYVAGEPDNERDFILNSVRDSQERARLIAARAGARDRGGGTRWPLRHRAPRCGLTAMTIAGRARLRRRRRSAP